MTPEQASALPQNSPQKRDWLAQASAREIQKLIHIGFFVSLSQPEYELARTAIEIRVAEDTANTVEKLTGETNRLTAQVGELVAIANEQKQLAVKLDAQTDKLIELTKALKIFTLVLVAVGLVQIYLMLKENPLAHIQQVQTSQNKQAGATNK